MYESDDDPDLLEQPFPVLLRVARKRTKKNQDTFGRELGLSTRQQVSDIETGKHTPAPLTQLVRRWLRQGGFDPRGKSAHRFYLKAGYPVYLPDCPHCFDDVLEMVSSRALECPHAAALIPPEERAKADARRTELLARKPGHPLHATTSSKES